MPNENIYNALYEKFIEEAKKYYESAYTEEFNFATTNFAGTLDKRIEEVVSKKLSKNKNLTKKLTQKYSTARKPPIKTTIYSYDFIRGATTITEATHNPTLHIISIFCGYEDFDEYKKQYKVSIETPIEQEEEVSVSEESTIIQPDDTVIRVNSFINKNRKALIVGSLLLIIGLIALSIKNNQELKSSLAIFGGSAGEDTLKEKITNLMINANRAEFTAYQTIPHSDTLTLNKYFTDYALRRIMKVVRGEIRKQHYLKEPESKAYFISVNEINPIFKDLIEVKTLEYWDIIWYDENTKKPIAATEYDKKQEHRYYVQREQDGSWRIILDLYY